MQLSCPGCKARINVPDDKIKPEGTKVKCGKCSKVFTVKKKTADTQPRSPNPTVPGGPASAPATATDPLTQSAASLEDRDLFAGDNFGAQMDDSPPQLRPRQRAPHAESFGSFDDRASARQSAPSDPFADIPSSQATSNTDDLLGPAHSSVKLDELFGEPEPAANSDDADLDKFVGALRNKPRSDEPKRPSRPTTMPAREELDDLFGKGLDEEKDELVTKLFDKPSAPSKTAAKATRESLDDLFASNDIVEPAVTRPAPPAPPKSPAMKLDALFSDDDSSPPAVQSRTAPPPPTKTVGAEELAATLKLEPALKEEDAPKPPPKAPEVTKPVAKPKRKLPVKALLGVLVVILILAGLGAAIYVPQVREPVTRLIRQIPLEKLTALFAKQTPPPPTAEPVRLTAMVSASRLLKGPRGDNIFVIEGSVRNDYPESRSFIKLRGTVYNKDGQPIAQREVFAGNTLNDEEIRGMDRIRINSILNRSVGGSLVNFNVPPGTAIPFQIILFDVDEPVAGEPRVEAIGSEPGN